jgi:hypothetical protein
MNLVIAALTLLLLAVVIAIISAPLRTTSTREPELTDRAELEAARESKYREIRDAELDYRTGKLSHEDFQAINNALRGEAMNILEELNPPEAERSIRAEPADPETLDTSSPQSVGESDS